MSGTSKGIRRRNLHELVRTNQPQNQPHNNRKPPPSRVMHDGRRGKLVLLTASFEFAAARCDDILYPFGLTAVREGDDEAIMRSEDIHGRPVDLPRLASNVGDDAEAGKPACK